jgi:hypothetical protein
MQCRQAEAGVIEGVVIETSRVTCSKTNPEVGKEYGVDVLEISRKGIAREQYCS